MRTTYLTGVLTGLAQEVVNVLFWMRDGPAGTGRPSYLRDTLELGDRRRARERMLELGAVWTGYLGGAVLGSFLHG